MPGSRWRSSITISVSDGQASDTDSVAVTVVGISNSLPAVEIGDSQTAGELSPVSLTGTASDPDLGDTLTYTFTISHDTNSPSDARGVVVTDGDYRISGVPGTGAEIPVEFLDPAGGVTGELLPTGSRSKLRWSVPPAVFMVTWSAERSANGFNQAWKIGTTAAFSWA